MSQSSRPWWVLALRPPGLITTITETTENGERVITVKGQPLIHGLTWVTWGPLVAVVTVILYTQVAVMFNIREQSWMVWSLFVMTFLLIPVGSWIGASALMSYLGTPYIEAQRKAETQQAVLRLNQRAGFLVYQLPTASEPRTLTFADIDHLEVEVAFGQKNSAVYQLVAETEDGPLIILPPSLGSQTQKEEVAQLIRRTMLKSRV